MAADLKRIEGRNFLIIGRAGMDMYAHPPGVKTEDAEYFYSALGGSSANIGVALVKLGSKASLVTSVSDDSVGRYCLNQLDHYGVDRTFVRSVAGEERNSLAVLETTNIDHQSVIYRNNAADFQMTVEDVRKPDYTAYSAAITTGTVFAGQPSRDAAFVAFDLAKEAGLPVIFDIDYRPYSWTSGAEAAEVYSRAASYCDIVIGNDDEFGVMAGDYDIGLAFAENLAKTSAQIVVYKMGHLGSITFTQDGSFKTGIFPVDALKPTGAGDSFMGAFIASMAAGMDVQTCVERGSAAAAIVVSNVACAPAMPTPDILEDFIASHPGITKP
ncbi:5-dehydro-2-deoxygluconokinase [Pseudahrensia aquimaris]|uniref:5-dehydro-2-deoxygluconokinase n=1 Tax=Pseudahrensia aquimaris TaxID=744461 RepID=A0ABW3FKD4_9HYPH